MIDCPHITGQDACSICKELHEAKQAVIDLTEVIRITNEKFEIYLRAMKRSGLKLSECHCGRKTLAGIGYPSHCKFCLPMEE